MGRASAKKKRGGVVLAGLAGLGLWPYAAWGCAGDTASEPAVRQAATQPERDAAAASTRPNEDAMRAPERPECDSAPPVIAAELRARASGASVYGRVIKGERGSFDAYGTTACGLAGARICLAESTTCTESDGAGQFVLLGLPDNSAEEITIEKPGYGSVLRLVTLGTTPVDLNQSRLVTSATGSMSKPGTGVIVAFAVIAGEAIGAIRLAGEATLTIEPGGLSPLYSVGSTETPGLSSDEIDPSLTETQLDGWGVFPNLAPGDYQLHVERNGTPCGMFVPGYSLGTDDAGDIMLHVRAGFVTTAAAYCP